MAVTELGQRIADTDLPKGKVLITEATRIDKSGTRIYRGTTPSGRSYTRRESDIEKARRLSKKRVLTAITQLPQSKQVLFVKREATRVHEEIKKQTRKIPTLQDIGMAGYKYGKAHPNSARLIYNSLDAKARIIRKIVPKEAGIPAAKAMFAFSDGAIKGIRNEPVKTLAFFALPGVVGVAGKVAKGIPVASKLIKSEKAMKAAAIGFDIVYSHNVYTRVNAPVLDYYKDGKVISETSKTLPDGSIQISQKIEQIPVMRKPKTDEKAERLGYVFSTEAGPMVFGAMGLQKVSKVRFNELARKGVKTTKTTVKTITKPSEIKRVTQQKVSDIKKAKKIKELRKRRAAVEEKVLKEKIKTLEVTKTGELKLLETNRSKLLKEQAKAKGKERIDTQKRLKEVEKNIKTAEKKALQKKVKTVEVTKTGKLKVVIKTRKQVLKDIEKAKAKEAKELKKRQKKAEKIAETKKVKVLKVTKKGELKLLETNRSKLLKEQAKAKGKERIAIQKRLKKVEKELAFKQAFKPKKKTVTLSDSAYSNITKLSKLKAKSNAQIAKIGAIPTHVAKRIGLNKSKEIKRLTVRLRETDVVKSYFVLVKKGVPKNTAVEKLQKLPENKLQVLDTKTGTIIKNIEKTVDDIELRVIKPSKKPPTEYKEVKMAKGMVQLQKVVQKQEIKTVVLAKTELKALQKLNTEAKSIVKTKPKTKTAQKIKQKQLTKVNTKIKSKRKQLLQLRFKLRSNNTKLKQKHRLLTILISKQKGAEKAKTKEIITIINRQITINNDVIGFVTETIVVPVPKEIIIPVPIPKPKPKIKIIPVPRIIPVGVPIKKKVKPKKKKKMTATQYRDWFVKNEIPTLKSLYG